MFHDFIQNRRIAAVGTKAVALSHQLDDRLMRAEEEIAGLRLMNEVLLKLVKENLKISDKEIEDKLNIVKQERNEMFECRKCKHSILKNSKRCVYCGETF